MNTPRLILAGGSGFLGRVLAKRFSGRGWEVVILTRSPHATAGPVRECLWDTRTVGDWKKELDGAAAVINLTGRGVDCRYNQRNRREIIESRVNSTRA
ncbi:MAG: NAD-dependent epimerase/dehydratase family protein, partial [Verrucomicrobia bacterium]|nr:NAD-dependent epimerase/dehydratase family protein [Verrucomicrobiota bacterium]